jgi:hypothetical protein
MLNGKINVYRISYYREKKVFWTIALAFARQVVRAGETLIGITESVVAGSFPLVATQGKRLPWSLIRKTLKWLAACLPPAPKIRKSRTSLLSMSMICRLFPEEGLRMRATLLKK